LNVIDTDPAVAVEVRNVAPVAPVMTKLEPPPPPPAPVPPAVEGQRRVTSADAR
jgi:hypothetical protein